MEHLRFRRVVAFASCLIGASMVMGAAPTPDPRTLFVEEHAAVGGAAWDRLAEIVEHGTFSGQGLTGPYVSYIDPRGGLSKIVLQLAGSTQGQGYDRAGLWAQQNALVTPLNDPASLATARTNAYVARNGWWRPDEDPAAISYIGQEACGDRSCDLVRVVPQGGNPVDVWLDATTHLIAKIVERDLTNAVTTTSYADYRKVQGVVYPFATTQGNGDVKYDQHTKVDTVTFSPTLADSDVTRPQNQRNGTIAGGAISTTVPFEEPDPGRSLIVVIARINGSRPLHVLFDTGGTNTLGLQAAKEIGLSGKGTLGVNGSNGQQATAQLAADVTLSLGAATLRDQQFGLIDFPAALIGLTGRYRIDGVIGYEVLKNFAVSIDFVHRRLTLTEPAAFHYAGGGAAIPFKSAIVPVVPGLLNNARGDFYFDTGNGFYNTVSSGFFATNHLSLPRSTIQVQSTFGQGGATRSSLIRAGSLTIGPYLLSRPVFAVSNAQRGTAIAGNIGNGVLSRFDIALDYSRDVLYMKPNRNFAKPFVGTLDGMSLSRRNLQSLEITYVNADSPAAKAGLRAGDAIIKVKGLPMPLLGAADIAAFEETHSSLPVTYERHGKMHTTNVLLTEMLP